MDIMESVRVVSHRGGFIVVCPAEVIRSTAYMQESRVRDSRGSRRMKAGETGARREH